MELMFARWLIQLRLEDGRLPHGQATDLRQRPGDGESWCDGCSMILSTAEKTVIGIVPDDWRQIRLHWPCFLIWNKERLADHQHRR